MESDNIYGNQPIADPFNNLSSIRDTAPAFVKDNEMEDLKDNVQIN